ncbi:MAG: hypothetical protein QG632_895 [Candidatus Dependentiae bacterium]|nr:hypothetical protein [Candidatus Dependentiae bacterium]
MGNLYTLAGSGRRPGILVVSGSDGGMPGANAIPESFIAHLVENGFVVFALAYFSYEELPERLENIPLEYFESALLWLRSCPEVDPARIGLVGQSRGGELSLLLGAKFPSLVQAIVACAPSGIAWGGFPYPNRLAWTLHNQPVLPAVGALSGENDSITELNDLVWAMHTGRIPTHANDEHDPSHLTDLFEARCHSPRAAAAEIPVENIQCPILLLSGDKDAIWPAEFFCNSIMRRLRAHAFSFYMQHKNYEGAGHGIWSSRQGALYHPVGQFWCQLGGTREASLSAHERSWADVVKFLKESL